MPPDSVFQRTDSKRHCFDKTDSRRHPYINQFVRINWIKRSFVLEYYSHNPFVYIYNLNDYSVATGSGLGHPKIIMLRLPNGLLLGIFKIPAKSIAGEAVLGSCYFVIVNLGM